MAVGSQPVKYSFAALYAIGTWLFVTGCSGRLLGTASEEVDGRDGAIVDGAARDSSRTALDSSDKVKSDSSGLNTSTPSVASASTSNVENDGAVLCRYLIKSFGSSGPDCTMTSVERCSDGTVYEASCMCEGGSCRCWAQNGSFQMNTNVPFTTVCAPSCMITPAEALKACGFPADPLPP